MIYTFSLVVDQDPTAYSDALWEVGHGNLIPEGGGGQPGVIHCSIVATSLENAMVIAIHAIQAAGLKVTGVLSDGTVGRSE